MTSKKERNIMNTVQKCLFGGALLGAGLSNTAMADIHIEDTLEFTIITGGYDYFDGGGYAFGFLEIHRFDFTVLSDGNVQLDMLSENSFDAFFNTQIMLFNNDGNPLDTGNLIFTNNNHGGLDFNGSISVLDSFLDVFLAAGDYTIAVGAFEFIEQDAETGVNHTRASSNISRAVAETGGQYELDIIGNVAITGVPTPGTLALLGLGGLAATRRRR